MSKRLAPGTLVRILPSDPRAPYGHMHQGRVGRVMTPEDMVYSGGRFTVPVRFVDESYPDQAWFTKREVEPI